MSKFFASRSRLASAARRLLARHSRLATRHCSLRFRLDFQDLLIREREEIVQRDMSIRRRRGVLRNWLASLHQDFPFALGCGCAGIWARAAWLIARRCASACARTLAKPAGLVMRADWPASELDQRLHSSNSTAWSSRSWSTGTEGSTKAC